MAVFNRNDSKKHEKIEAARALPKVCQQNTNDDGQ